MVGRSSWCLLAIFILSLTPTLTAQAHDPQAGAPALRQSLRGIADEPALPFSKAVPTKAPFLPGLREKSSGGFQEMVRAAGMIFSATVINVERRPGSRGQTVETVAITFRVEQAFRGATRGENLTISQWIGLWSTGQRYRIGERVLLFLYRKSRLGLTSCVAGDLGRFNVDSSGRVLISAEQLSMLRRDPVVGGKSRVRLGDFALAVRHADEEE